MANTKGVEQEILDLERGKVEALRASGEVAAKWFERHFADDIAYTTGNGGYSTSTLHKKLENDTEKLRLPL